MAEIENDYVILPNPKSSSTSRSVIRSPSTGAVNKLYNSSSINHVASVKNLYSTPILNMVSASQSIKSNFNKLFKSSKHSKHHVTEQSQSSSSMLDLLKRSNAPPPPSIFTNTSSIRLPGTEDRIVVYFTSLHGIRRTYNDCYEVRMIFRGFRVYVDERDLSMDLAYKNELYDVLDEKNVSLPQVFIKGKYVGGVDVIRLLNENEELSKILEGIPKMKLGYVCEECWGARFMPCTICDGSRKVFDEDENALKKCLDCNENGLIRCWKCSY